MRKGRERSGKRDINMLKNKKKEEFESKSKKRKAERTDAGEKNNK